MFWDDINQVRQSQAGRDTSLLGSGCSSSPTAPSDLYGFARTPTPAGGAARWSLFSETQPRVSMTKPLVFWSPWPGWALTVEGRFVETPEIGSLCSAGVEVSDFTLEPYATRDRVGMPLLTAVKAGPWTCCRIAQTLYEHTYGPFPTNLDPEVIAFRVTVHSNDPRPASRYARCRPRDPACRV